MSAIQVLRAQAYAAGNLKSGPQITVVQQSPQKSGSQTAVVQQSPQTIVIQPANPQVVYVPQYNPAVVYGTPVQTPGYSSATVAATGLLAFGVGIAVGAAINNNNRCCGWSYSYWNTNWYGGAVHYRGTVYHGNNAWRGGYYGSTATAYGPYGAARVSSGYNPSTGTYARGGTVATPYGSRSAGQAYNPSTGTYARGTSASGAYGSAAAGQAYNPRTGASARGASASTAYGSAAAGQAYNPTTGAYGATRQTSNAYGTAGSSVATKNGQAAYTQHRTTAQGSVGTVQTTTGAKGVAATGANGNTGAVGQTANGNKYAASSNGNVYQNTGGGWQSNPGDPSPDTHYLQLLGHQFCCCSGLWRAAKEQRDNGFRGRWRRLASPAGERSWFCKPRWWQRLARPQVSSVAPSTGGRRVVSGVGEGNSMSVWR